MKELNNLVTRLDSICRKTIEDIDKSDINDFGITYCETSIQKGTSDGYDVVVRFHKWGSKSFVDERGHYCGTFDSYYIHIPLEGLTEERLISSIYTYFIEKKYDICDYGEW